MPPSMVTNMFSSPFELKVLSSVIGLVPVSMVYVPNPRVNPMAEFFFHDCNRSANPASIGLSHPPTNSNMEVVSSDW